MEAPSIGLGLLKAQLEEASHQVYVLDLHLDFARLLGAERYRTIASEAGIGTFAGEWIFAQLLFPELDPEDDVRDVLRGGDPEQPVVHSREVVATILDARRKASAFVAAATRQILAMAPDVVGLHIAVEGSVQAPSVAGWCSGPSVVSLPRTASRPGSGTRRPTATLWLPSVCSRPDPNYT